MCILRLLTAIAAAALFVGCGSSKLPGPVAALDIADEFVLLSLDPDRHSEKTGTKFHDWRELGRTSVKERATRNRLLSALDRGAKENDGRVAACFDPRHGIHATSAGKVIDLVICFRCLQVEVFTDGKPTGGFLTSSSPQPIFDQVLHNAGVPLPKAAE